MMKILIVCFIAITTALLFSCAATMQRPRVYKTQGVDFATFINDTTAIYEPLLFRVDNRGLHGELTQQQRQIIKTMAQEIFRTSLAEKLMPKMIENDHKRSLFKWHDPQNELRRVFARNRGKLTGNFDLDGSHIKTAKKFREDSRIRFAVVPSEIIVTRNLLEQIGERATIQYNISTYFQIWDLKKGDIILEKKNHHRGENTFYDFESELKFLENAFFLLAEQLFFSISMNAAN